MEGVSRLLFAWWGYSVTHANSDRVVGVDSKSSVTTKSELTHSTSLLRSTLQQVACESMVTWNRLCDVHPGKLVHFGYLICLFRELCGGPAWQLGNTRVPGLGQDILRCRYHALIDVIRGQSTHGPSLFHHVDSHALWRQILWREHVG